MLNKKDIIKALLIMLVFLITVVVSCHYIDKDNEEKDLILPFKMLKGDAIYEMRCLDGYAYIIYKERGDRDFTYYCVDSRLYLESKNGNRNATSTYEHGYG